MNDLLYSTIFLKILAPILREQDVFYNAFGDTQVRDGISETETAFIVKQAPEPVALQSYDKTKKIDTDSRFGPINENIYTNIEVKYSPEKAFNELVDKATINADEAAAVLGVLEAKGKQLAKDMRVLKGEILSKNVSKTHTLADFSNDAVEALFTDAYESFENKEIKEERTAYVTPRLKAVIAKHPATTTEKRSDANIGTFEVSMFGGFVIQSVPEGYFKGKDVAYFSADLVGMAFTGITEVRVIQTEKAMGSLVQGILKPGVDIQKRNKVGIEKATLADEAAEAGE